MAFLGNMVNPDLPPAEDFAPLPSGEYPAIITDSEMKPTKNRNGQYLELTYQVTDGPLKGRLVWERLNLDNPSAKAVEIAQRSLNSLIAALGLTQVQDSQQLHNRPLVIRVEFVKADGVKRTSDTNEVKAHKKLEGATSVQSQPAANQAAPAQPAAPAAPPWAQKSAA